LTHGDRRSNRDSERLRLFSAINSVQGVYLYTPGQMAFESLNNTNNLPLTRGNLSSFEESLRMALL